MQIRQFIAALILKCLAHYFEVKCMVKHNHYSQIINGQVPLKSNKHVRCHSNSKMQDGIKFPTCSEFLQIHCMGQELLQPCPRAFAPDSRCCLSKTKSPWIKVKVLLL